MVRPPVTDFDEDGKAIRPKPICYTDTWLHGFTALTAWKAGTYTPGMESEFKSEASSDVAERIISDYLRISKRTDGITFAEAYKEAYAWKSSHKTMSKSAEAAHKYGFEKCESIHNIPIKEIKQKDLQRIIDNSDQSASANQRIRTVMRLTYKYAMANDLVSSDYSTGLIISNTEIRHGQAFSDDELKYIYNHRDNEIYKKILIMCLSGFRVSAYNTLEINLEEGYFKGGVKTAAGKGRIVPIHSTILPLVKEIVEQEGYIKIAPTSSKVFTALKRINPSATPHWTRHTFSALCERFGVRENDRKRMLGHVVGDITNDVYGHRTLEDLKTEIEKIDVQKIVHQGT